MYDCVCRGVMSVLSVVFVVAVCVPAAVTMSE